MTDESQKIVVVGAGIVGVSTALWLAREGRGVTLIDKSAPGEGTSFGNAGLLASAATLPVPMPGILRKAPRMALDPREPLYLRWRHLPALLPWLIPYLRHASYDAATTRASAILPLIGDSLADHQALSAGTAAAKYVVPCDYVYAYPGREAFDADRFNWDLRKSQGFTINTLEAKDLRAYDPSYSDKIGFAAVMPNHGRISDPGAYVKALARAAEAKGVTILQGEVTGVARDAGRITGVRMGRETLSCEAVVITAGAWSKMLTESLGIKVPLHPESGFHMELWAPSMTPRSPLMYAAGKFVITPMQGRIRMAGMVGFGGFDAPMPKAPFRMFEKHIKALMPDLRWEASTKWMGHRPSMTDSLPMIGAVPGAEGAFVGFGHDHLGLTAGPKTGRLLAQIITGQRPNIDVTPFDPGRFS